MERPLDNKVFDDLCAEYLVLEEAKNNLNDKQKTAKDKLVSMCDGLDQYDSSHNNISIKRVEAWTWDQTLLSAMEAVIPEISKTYGITKDVYHTLPIAVQAQLCVALTTKLGRTTIKITPTTAGDS